MMRRVFLLLAFLLITISVSAYTVGGDDTQPLPNDTDVTLTLPEFNGLLSDLTGIYVEVELRLSGAQVQLDNDSGDPQDGTARVINTANSLTSTVSLLKVGMSDTINTGDLTINATQVFNLGATSGDTVGQFDVTGNSDYGIWQPGTLTSGDSGNIASAVWSQYVGTGNFTIDVNTTYLTSATFEGELGYFEGNTPTGEIYARVIYTYVPEPTTIALFGVGFLALISRRKK